jgi:hypothetical protein
MDKGKVFAQIIAELEGQLQVLQQSVKAAHLAATHEESKAEDKYDTRGLEASYLAGAQQARVEELAALLQTYRELPIKKFGKKDPIEATALVSLDSDGVKSQVLLGPGRPLSLKVDGKPLQVITPSSPLGEALLGKTAGDTVEIRVRGEWKEYEVLSVG